MNFRIRSSIQILSLGLILILLFSLVIIGSACNKDSETSSSIGLNSTGETTTSTSSGTYSSGEGKSSASTTAAETGKTTATSAPETETTAEEIPEEISGLITEADSYYADGEYAYASKTYRDAENAIEDSDLSEETKQQQLNLFAAKLKKAKEITDTARAHYGIARSYEYQQRYEEALKEYEAIIAIYPKYEDTIDLYHNLKAQMGLE